MNSGKSLLWIQYLFGKYGARWFCARSLTCFRLQEETAKVEEHLLQGSFTASIVKCFTTAKANAFENLLEPLQKLLRLSPPTALSLAHPDLFYRILQKLQSSKAVVRLNLLRIVRSICDASEEQGALIKHYGLEDSIQRLAEGDGAVLVRNMAGELLKSSEINERHTLSGSRRRHPRRSSSSTTPPSLLNSYSSPSTPIRSRTSQASSYYFERDKQQRNGGSGAIPFRPASRDSNKASGLPIMANGSGIKSRLPRTASTKPPQRQIVVSPTKSENQLPGQESQRATQVSTPNSRRRRQVSGELR